MDFICFDTEDDSKELMEAGLSGFDKKVTQIAAIAGNGDDFYSAGDVNKFLTWLRKRPETRIYALNTQYDLGNLFGDTPDCLDVTMVGGRLIKAMWGQKAFVDVFNLYQMSVKKLGEKFGLAKKDFDSKGREYVFRDVEIIHRAVSFAWEFCERVGIGACPSTIAGAAIRLWKFWGGVNIHDSGELSRCALYGGRVELFKPRNESRNVCYTDVNSLYPHVMRNEFPVIMEACSDIPAFGVAEVTVKQKETDLTVLPFRTPEGEIVYPWGMMKGAWTAAELRKACELGCKIEKFHSASGSSEGHKPYEEFVTRIYRLRKESSVEAEKVFYKLLMNNLYGRLGIQGVISRSVCRNPETEKQGVAYGEKVLVDYQMPLPDETNWSHAAHVTSYGRLALLSYIEKIGASNMIYCDTDSSIFDCSVKQIPFSVGPELGQMKLEAWETLCEAHAPKTYQFGDQYKAKGVPRRLAKDFIQQGRVEFALPFKLRESIRFFDEGNTKKLSVWRKIERIWQTRYKKKKLQNGRFFPSHVSKFMQ